MATTERNAESRQPLEASAADLSRMLAVIESEILPKTRTAVAAGNKVFGAAVLDDSLKTLVADTNHEMLSPLYHGEVYVIQRWAEQTPARERAASAARANFLSTHEPCCMCISSIVWSGFRRVYYFFPYEATTSQGIPYDVEIMHELWRVPTCKSLLRMLRTATSTLLHSLASLASAALSIFIGYETQTPGATSIVRRRRYKTSSSSYPVEKRKLN